MDVRLVPERSYHAGRIAVYTPPARRAAPARPSGNWERFLHEHATLPARADGGGPYQFEAILRSHGNGLTGRVLNTFS